MPILRGVLMSGFAEVVEGKTGVNMNEILVEVAS